MTASPNFPPISDDPIPPGSEPQNHMAGGEIGVDSCVDPTRRASLYRVDQPTGAPIPASVADSPRVRRAGEVVGYAFVMLVLVALTVFLAEILVKTGIWIWDM